jgi:uncharacterized protein (TIRG00374 family)
MKAALSRLLGLLVGIAIGGVLLTLAFRSTDWASVSAALRAGNWGWPALGVLCGTTLFVVAKAVRWRWLLGADQALTIVELVRPVAAGLALNALIPHAGEFVRAFALNRRRGLVASAVLSSIVAERVFDLFAVLLLAACALTLVSVPDAVAAAVRSLGVVAIIGSAGIVAVLAWPKPFYRLAEVMVRPLPDRLAQALLREVNAAIAGFRPVRSLRTSAFVLIWSLVQWLAIALCAGCSAWVVGDAVGVGGALLVVVGIVVAFLLPNAPGYAGSAQLAFLLALGASGVTPAHALAASVVYQLLMILPVVLIGLYWLRSSLSPTSET